MQHTHFCSAPLSSPWPPYIKNSVPCPIPIPESCLLHCISCSTYHSGCFWIILHRILFATGVRAMAWFFVHPLTSESVTSEQYVSITKRTNGCQIVQVSGIQCQLVSPWPLTICNPRWSEHQDKALRHSLHMADKVLVCLCFLRASYPHESVR
jgi:hypothetical protein